MQYKERDFPVGHPSSADYDPNSEEAKEWRRLNLHPKGERDFPVGHFAAADSEANINRPLYGDESRDFSRPHTIPKDEYEAVTGRNHAEDVAACQERDAAIAANRAAAAQPVA